jgi:hypothetical protein
VAETERPQLDHCAQRARTLTPELADELHAVVGVAPDGRVGSVRVEGGYVAARPFRACVDEALGTWRFPIREEGSEITFWVTLGEPVRPWQGR